MTRPIPEPLHPSARELPVPEGLASYPPVERWDDWEEYDPVAWPRKVKRRGRTPPSRPDRKSTRLNSSHVAISYAAFCLKKKTGYMTTASSHDCSRYMAVWSRSP